MTKTLRFLIFAGLATLGGAAATGRTPDAVSDNSTQPAIWLLSDEDTRIWMFGTVHILPPALDWRSAELEAIVRSVDELVLETDNGTGVFEKPELLERLMMRDTPLPVLDRIAPEYRNRYRLLLKSSGLAADAFDGFETWAVSLILIMASASGYAGDLPAGEMPSGVEIELSTLFDDQDKPITGVETQNDQLGVFRNLSEEGQRALLEDMLAEVGEIDEAETEDTTLDSWLTGNTDALASECDSYEELPPESFRRLITDRNRAWTEWLADRLEQPGDILFAVGACHLAGRSSLQTMLAARGLATERVH